jgi:hypothetical protein
VSRSLEGRSRRRDRLQSGAASRSPQSAPQVTAGARGRGGPDDPKSRVPWGGAPGERAFYIFAIITNGKHSKAILTISLTHLPLLFQHPFTITLFADVARHDHLPRRHPHAT